jgi:hypothetical protein
VSEDDFIGAIMAEDTDGDAIMVTPEEWGRRPFLGARWDKEAGDWEQG